VDEEYVAREDVLDLYAEQPDKKHPVVSFDESPQQLIGEVREPLSAGPVQVQRYDSEYRGDGTANLFVMLDVHQPGRQVKVTDHRAGEDFAECMRDLVDLHYPRAENPRGSGQSLHALSGFVVTHFPRRKRGGSCVTSSSTTRSSTPADLTWWKSRSES
jgi:hypothetical protein